VICMVLSRAIIYFSAGANSCDQSVKRVSRKIKLVEGTCQNASLSRACKAELARRVSKTKFYLVCKAISIIANIF